MQSSYEITEGFLSELPRANLLLVSANETLRKECKERVAHTQWIIREARSGADALEKLMEAVSELMLLDPQLPDLSAPEFEALVRSEFPSLQIITLATQDDVRLGSSGPRALSTPGRPTLRTDSFGFSASGPREGASRWHDLVGGSKAMQRVYHAGRLVARRDTTVLIQGESGTGKDLLARAIHVSSPRERQPFVVINCAAIPETLLEAELFGYTKGAFTGAAQSRIGRIHAAHGGTLFLDEIGDMPFPLQSKLLRFLEQGEVQRIGGTDTLKVDCRVLAATNADLKRLVKANQFREDLFYRLAVFPIALPPLRERMDDLDALIEFFLERLCPGCDISPAAREILSSHDWPGNVRELRNVLERAGLFAEERRVIEPEDIFF